MRMFSSLVSPKSPSWKLLSRSRASFKPGVLLKTSTSGASYTISLRIVSTFPPRRGSGCSRNPGAHNCILTKINKKMLNMLKANKN